MSLNTKKLFTLLITLLIMLQPIAIFGDDTKETKITYEVKAHISYIGIDKETELFFDDISVGEPIDLHIEDVPRIEGKVFVGWYTDLDDESTLLKENTIASEHLTLYAKYLDPKDANIFITYDEDNSDYKANIEALIDDRDLTNEERYLLSQGESLYFVLTIKNTTDIKDSNKELLDSAISKDKNILLNYLDISLVDITEEITKEELHNPITITLTIPEEDYASNRIYTIYAIDKQGNVITLYSDKANSNHQISFDTFLFNDLTNFAFSYRKKHRPDPYNPIQTGIDYIDMPITNNPVIRLTLHLVLISTLICVLLNISRKEEK